MSDRRFVYNPADPDFERHTFRYNNLDFKLSPNAVNEIHSPWPHITVETILTACLQQLAGVGVVEVPHSDDEELWNKNVAAATEAAEAVHANYLRATLGKIVNAYAEKVAYARSADVEMEPTDQVKRAKAKLVEWGIITALLVLSLASSAVAQVSPRFVAAKYDLDATDATCFAFEALPRDEGDRIQTSGSSATVTASAGTPFDDVAENDQLIIGNPTLGTAALRTVIARASATSITVDSAINIATGAAFTWRRMQAGTGITNGWFAMNKRRATVSIYIAQATVTGGIDMNLQCATFAADGTRRQHQVYPTLTPPDAGPTYTNFTTFPVGFAVDIPNVWDVCRVCAKVGTSDAADTGTDREQITVGVEFGDLVN